MAEITKSIGKVSVIPRGNYGNTLSYKRLDIVNFNGNSYICIKDAAPNTYPNNEEHWMLLAQRGYTNAITKTATLKADMTDQRYVYVYIGSESGMTNGDWYYYDPTSGVTDWVSGGVYNPTFSTDTTLTETGEAADAKVVGDKFATTMYYKGQLAESQNLDVLVSNGSYYISAAVATAWHNNGFPYTGICRIHVLGGTTNTRAVQIAVSSTQMSYRIHNGTTWGGWREIGDTDTTLSITGMAADAKTVGDWKRDGYIYQQASNSVADCNYDFDQMLECATYFITTSMTMTNSPFTVAFNGTASVLSFKTAGGALWYFQLVEASSPSSVKGLVYWRNIKADGTGATPWVALRAGDVTYDAIKNNAGAYTPFDNGSSTQISHDLNELLAEGNYYLNAQDIVNAPLSLTSGAFIISNSSFHTSTTRSILQRCVIQDPAMHRYETWYRFIRTTDLTVYIDWFTTDSARLLKNITIFGDSITAGYPQVDTATYHWWEYLKKYYTLSNFAESGAGIVYKAGNRNGCTFADEFTDNTAHYLIIFMGTNDYGNNIALGTPSDPASNNGTFCAGLRYVIETVYTNHPSISIIGVLPLNRTRIGTSDPLTPQNKYAYGSTNSAGYTLGDLCNAAESIYHNYGIPVIDSRYSQFQIGNLPTLLDDGLHPTVNGYRHLASFLGGQIKSIINPL